MIAVTCVDKGDPLVFAVTITEGASETRHRVTMGKAHFAKLTPGEQSAEQCIKAAFAFLLDREPKESILAEFDVSVIARYFPEFDSKLPAYLART
ncbi:MAG TPA: hypothetical protein VFI93_11455 [Rhizomicrobium sp.]|jgi:hypothetical protein|nr:hypothetical protein [Rhizomicrobium sp.]